MTNREWISRIRELAIRYECQSKHHDTMKIESAQRESEWYFSHGFEKKSNAKKHEVELWNSIKSDHKDISKALYEYAGILERLMECRNHMIPHKRDTEIIDYIATGARYDDTTK